MNTWGSWTKYRGFGGQQASVIDLTSVSVTAWSTSDASDGSISSPIIFSNSNLTVAISSDGGSPSGRAIANATSGRYYWEITGDVITSGSGNLCGVSNGTFVVNNSALGSNANSVGVDRDGNVGFNGNPTFGSVAGWSAGETRCLAFSVNSGLIWFRTGSSYWNASSLADPGSSVGGIDVSAMSSTIRFPAYTIQFSSERQTANFGGSPYVGTVPSGYTNWPG